MSAADRFWAKVEKNGANGCWIWAGARNGQGYGNFWLEGHYVSAHRFAYRLLIGEPAVGLDLDHLCRVPACVNPIHLEPVTHRENVRRGSSLAALNAEKVQCLRGHAFTEVNTYIDAKGQRSCRICRAAAARAYRARRRVA